MDYNNTACYNVDLFTPDSLVFVIATIKLDKIIMNEKHIQQILDIEKQARAVYESAIKEAELLPLQAEKDAQKVIEQARLDAENEARQMIEKAKAQNEIANILAEAEKQVQRNDVIAARNIDRTVSHVINRVVGREQF
jgi:vacuolar-type H+-ATPase subunit H